MYKSKLIQLYNAFSKEDLFKLRKWLANNKQQQHPDAVKLLEILLKKPSVTELVAKRERLFKQLYPKQVFNMNRLRHVTSFALKSLEEFIKQKELFKDELTEQKTLANSYKQYHLKKYAQQHLDKAKNILNKQVERDASYYLSCYELELEQFKLIALEERPTSTNLQEVIDGFSTFFIINLLRYACTSLSHQNLFKTSYKLPFLKEALEAIKGGEYDEYPTVLMYYYSYVAQTEAEGNDSFKKLKHYLLNYQHLLKPIEYQQLYKLGINYCIKQQNSGHTDFIQEAFDWYKRGIETSILLDEKGKLGRFTYLNTITLALKLKHYDWVENFIKTGVELLEVQYQFSYLNYNMGKFYFLTGVYTKAMPLLSQITYDDLFMKIDIRVMLLKIYYEEQSWTALEHLLNSFHVFLQRKSVLSYHKNNYLNLIKFTRLLVEDTMDKKELIEVITDANPLTERRWLLAQIALKNKV